MKNIIKLPANFCAWLINQFRQTHRRAKSSIDGGEGSPVYSQYFSEKCMTLLSVCECELKSKKYKVVLKVRRQGLKT